jgi:hypothetical protein
VAIRNEGSQLPIYSTNLKLLAETQKSQVQSTANNLLKCQSWYWSDLAKTNASTFTDFQTSYRLVDKSLRQLNLKIKS